MSHQPLKGITGRAYSRHAGVSAATVQRWKADGWLVLCDDGSIDKMASDKRVAEQRQAARAEAESGPLAVARQRKLAAEVANLEDEVSGIKARLIPAADAVWARRLVFVGCARDLLAIAPTAAPLVAGQPAALAKDRLTEVIHETMTRMSETDYLTDPDALPAEDPAPAPAGDLAARKAELDAERLELRRAVRRHDMLESEDLVRALQSKLGPARARLLGLPNRLAPRFCGQDVTAAEKAIREAVIGEVMPEMAGRLPGCGDLTVAEMLAEAEAAGGG